MNPLHHCFLITVAVMFVLSACARNPATGKSDFVLMTEQDEIELGREAHDQIVKHFGGAYSDVALQDYVRRVGAHLAAKGDRVNLVYRFTVLDSPEVNAFALPGGYIYITRGLLAYLNSEAEMAAVLGHEIGHVTARHSVRQISGTRAAQIGYTIGSVFVPELRNQVGQGLFNVLGSALTSGYGREHELEADRLGAEYLARSGYDPLAMLKVLGVLKDQELYERQLAKEDGRKPRIYHGVFASHPSSDQRLQEVVGNAGSPEPSGTVHRQEDYLHYLDGMVYGDGEAAGVVRAGVFYHAALGVGFALPTGWSCENLPERLLLHAPGRKAVLQVAVEDLDRHMSSREFLQSRIKSISIRDEEDIRPGGLEGYSVQIESGASSSRKVERLSVVYHKDHAYLFTGISKKPDEFARYDPEFTAVVASFHALSPEEQGLAGALRIRLLNAQEGVDMTELARFSPLQGHAEEQLRLLNQLYPDGTPVPGTLLKSIQ